MCGSALFVVKGNFNLLAVLYVRTSPRPLSYERRCWVTFEHSTNIKDVIARISANLVRLSMSDVQYVCTVCVYIRTYIHM